MMSDAIRRLADFRDGVNAAIKILEEAEREEVAMMMAMQKVKK